MKLAGKVAIVTGSARGLGAAMARKFASEGASVVVTDILVEQAKRIASDIQKSGGKAVALKTDVTRKAEVQNLVKEAISNFGAVHILVNNAGFMRQAPLVEMTEEDWDDILDGNLKSVFLCIQAVLPHMMEQHYGKIINMSAVGGIHAINPGRGAFSSAKAGVAQLTRIAASEAGQYGITVNAIAPGTVPHHEDKPVPQGRKEVTERMDAIYKSRAVLGHLGEPADIANLALFLASEDSKFITGQVICCDGGLFLNISDGLMWNTKS